MDLKLDSRLLAVSAGIFYGSITVGGSLLAKQGLSALDLSFSFLAFSLVPLAPFALRREFLGQVRASWKYLSVYGIANTGLVVFSFESLKLGVAPAIVALLLYTQPIWTVIFGRYFFKEKIDLEKVGIIVVAILGTSLIINPINIAHDLASGNTSNTVLGELIALVAGVLLSLWIILGKSL